MVVSDDNVSFGIFVQVVLLVDDCHWYFKQIGLWSQPVYVHQLQNLFYALTNEELEIYLGRFNNLAMMGPVDFFVKPIEKNHRIRELL